MMNHNSEAVVFNRETEVETTESWREATTDIDDSLIYLALNSSGPVAGTTTLCTEKTLGKSGVHILRGAESELLFGPTTVRFAFSNDGFGQSREPDKSEFCKNDPWCKRLNAELRFSISTRSIKNKAWLKSNGYPEDWIIMSMERRHILRDGTSRSQSKLLARQMPNNDIKWLNFDPLKACDFSIGESPAMVSKGMQWDFLFANAIEFAEYYNWSVHARIKGVWQPGRVSLPTTAEGVSAIRDLQSTGTSIRKPQLIKWIQSYSRVVKDRAQSVTAHLRGNHKLEVDDLELCIVPPYDVLQIELGRKGTRAKLVADWLAE